MRTRRGRRGEGEGKEEETGGSRGLSEGGKRRRQKEGPGKRLEFKEPRELYKYVIDIRAGIA